MNYCEIGEDNRQHILNLISWINDEVLSAGGDGDFLWYSRFYNAKDILPILEEFGEITDFKWWNTSFDENSGTIYVGHNQEGFTITNDESRYLNAPSWQQGLLKY